MKQRHRPAFAALLGRVRRRRQRRGAAMVEGAVAIPFFMLMLAGAIFIGGFYAQRIDAQIQARQETWRIAVNENCDAGANSALPGLTIIDSADLEELSRSPLAALCNKDFGSVSFTARREYVVTGPFGFDKQIMATAMCPCNESPVAGDVAYESAVEFLWEAYQTQGNAPGNVPIPTMFNFGPIFRSGMIL